MKLTEELKQEYRKLFDTCTIKPDKTPLLKGIINKINSNKSRYEAVGNKLNIPWYFIAVIHNMECSLNFKGHLHNGDPLTARTTHVPAGRPLTGNPPFTWEQSAGDALQLMKLHLWKDWGIEGMLYKLEAYNGWGYRRKHPNVLSPYLWSFSNHYEKGKYVADGRWSETAISNQCGAAVILKDIYKLTIPADADTHDIAKEHAEHIGPEPLPRENLT
jgi:lysozyme family protein